MSGQPSAPWLSKDGSDLGSGRAGLSGLTGIPREKNKKPLDFLKNFPKTTIPKKP